MARTKATVGAKVHSGKSSKVRCSVAPATSSGTSSSASSNKTPRSAGGGNSVCPRETPKWQKPITTFFINQPAGKPSDTDGKAAGSSKAKPKRNIIESSDEETSPGKPKNKELDETIELEELTGENSHKIEEYYPIGAKGKGIGKKTKKRDSETKDGEATEDNGGHKNGDKDGNSSESQSWKETEDITEQEEGSKDKEENESTSEMEDITEENDKDNVSDVSDENKGKNENSSKTKGKENINSNTKKRKSEKEDESEENDKYNNIKNRIKRGREDRLDEGNVSKKIKV